MGLKRKAAPRLDPEVHETAWVGDDAIDREASDVNGWCETADHTRLKALPGKGDDLSIIRYRGLTDREVALLPRGEEAGSVHPLWFVEAARYGIVSIKGVPLHRRRVGGVSGLSDATMDELMEMRDSLPVVLASRVLLDDPSEVEAPEAPENVETALPDWLGVHILGLTFRNRKRNV